MRPLLIAFLLAAAAAAAPPARAAPATVTLEHSTASLVAATSGWSAGAPLRLGLRLALKPGWHTYWSNPGDAGLAPDATVSLDGAKPVAAQLGFPAPARLPTGPLMGYGYEGEVLFAFTVTPGATTTGPLGVAVHADWLVCAAVCVPESADLALTLPPAAGVALDPSADAPLFARAAQAMPRASPFAATLSPSGLLSVTGDGIGPQSVTAAWFIPATPGQIDQAAAQALAVSTGRLTLSLHPQPGLAATAPLAGVLALKDAAGQESDLLLSARRGDAAPITADPATAAPAAGLAHLLLLALAGGLILNLMPCVFPILAMKAVALGRHGRGEQSALRRSAALYTLGILASFLAIGIATLALRAAGTGAGWGFQFQSPVFVALMAWLLFAVGLNLVGLFEIGAGVVGAGSGLAARGGAFGDLMTGVLAVLVATPCTAPFMGAAVAAALAGPPIGGIAIFLALGAGLALPSLVIGFVPGAARLMPRPGAWMSVVRQVLAFPMFAASVWLLWVLTEEAGPDGILAGLSGALLIAFAGWLFGLGQRGQFRNPARTVLGAMALASVLVAFSLLRGLTLAAPVPTTPVVGGAEPFSDTRLAALRHDGRPVFVDMSAAWCITCLVNERIALDPASVRDAFAAHHVALLRGDWTRRDAAITRYLDHFGRNGVPLYVFYPAGGAPLVLPQILTPGLVTNLVGGAS